MKLNGDVEKKTMLSLDMCFSYVSFRTYQDICLKIPKSLWRSTTFTWVQRCGLQEQSKVTWKSTREFIWILQLLMPIKVQCNAPIKYLVVHSGCEDPVLYNVAKLRGLGRVRSFHYIRMCAHSTSPKLILPISTFPSQFAPFIHLFGPENICCMSHQKFIYFWDIPPMAFAFRACASVPHWSVFSFLQKRES